MKIKELKRKSKELISRINYRCNNKNNKHYKNYGGRGIKNYLSWQEIFYLMLRDKYIKQNNPTIDRIDNDGNYELNNCQFIEMEENRIKDRKKTNFTI